MAWWRERLEELDRGVAAPPEPRLQAVASELLPRGITGNELSQLEDCWLPLLEPFHWGERQVNALMLRGRLLFGFGARLLGSKGAQEERFGAVWSLVDGIRHCSDRQSREVLIDRAKLEIAELPRRRIRGELRPLTMIAAFAAYDVHHDGHGGWGRVRSVLAHSLFGMMPR